MFRQPGNPMTAVEIVSCRYDGPIPADVMAQARAEDSRFAAENPSYKRRHPTPIEESQMMVGYYADKVRRMIAAKRECDKAGTFNSAWTPGQLRSWFRAWRQERRQLAKLLAAARS